MYITPVPFGGEKVEHYTHNPSSETDEDVIVVPATQPTTMFFQRKNQTVTVKPFPPEQPLKAKEERKQIDLYDITYNHNFNRKFQSFMKEHYLNLKVLYEHIQIERTFEDFCIFCFTQTSSI